MSDISLQCDECGAPQYDCECDEACARCGFSRCSCLGGRKKRRDPVHPSRYDEDYFEHGPIAGVSGYMNYSWMPERTLRMAHHLIASLPIKPGERVLDFGCAKGFLVKALRILDVEAWGVDVSEYAIAHADQEVRRYLIQSAFSIKAPGMAGIYVNNEPCRFDWLIAKDVFEHLTEEELRCVLEDCSARRLFVAVPLGDGERFTIPAMDLDVTHRLAKSGAWWAETFQACGWRVDSFAHSFPGCKDDWTARFPEGNGFFVLSRL